MSNRSSDLRSHFFRRIKPLSEQKTPVKQSESTGAEETEVRQGRGKLFLISGEAGCVSVCEDRESQLATTTKRENACRSSRGAMLIYTS